MGIQHAPPPAILRRLLTAKGQLIGASAANTPVALAAGADGRILRARTAEALGFAWEDPAFAASVITSGTLPVARGGTGLGALGNALQVLRVNGTGNALEFADPAGGSIDGSGTTAHVAYWSDSNTLASEAQLAASRGGTGIDTSAGTNGQTLIHTGSAWALRRLPVQAAARVVGTASIEAWYAQDYYTNGLTTSTSPGRGNLRACLATFGKSGTIDRMGLALGAGVANSLGRWAIYTVGSNGYPDALVCESGELDMSTGTFVSATVSHAVTPGVYWFAYLGGGSADANPNVMSAPAPSFFTSAGVRVYGITVAQTYGAPPATFPAGAAAITNAAQIPVMYFRLSA